MQSWIEYWNADTPIYVNARHKTLHYRLIARDISGLIEKPGAAVLDHGCGEALSADLVAARAGRLYLCDAAEMVRARLGQRFGSLANVEVLAPEGVETIEDGALDLVVANSVAQYLTEPELIALLDLWRRKLKPGGRLILADVLPEGLSPLTDAMALLRFGFEGGFLFAAAGGLVRTAFSDYRRLRSELGLKSYTASEIIAHLTSAGFTARRLSRNLGHNQARMAFEGRV